MSLFLHGSLGMILGPEASLTLGPLLMVIPLSPDPELDTGRKGGLYFAFKGFGKVKVDIVTTGFPRCWVGVLVSGWQAMALRGLFPNVCEHAHTHTATTAAVTPNNHHLQK